MVEKQDLDKLNSENRKLEFLLEESRKQKTLATMIGEAVLECRKSIFKFFKLPFTIFSLRKKYLKGEIVPVKSRQFQTNVNADKIENDVILFMVTNGVGLGHLTRCLAVARQLKKTVGTKKIVFLTTSPSLHLIKKEGFIGFYVPSKEAFEDKITTNQWNEMLSLSFDSIFASYSINTIIFDGAIPYQSLAMVLTEQKDALKIWIKRGNDKKDSSGYRKTSENFFNYIVTPSEFGDSVLDSVERNITVNPIVYLLEEEQLSYNDVRLYFNVDNTKKLVYVQLGAGKINDISNINDLVVSILLEDPNTHVILGESPLGDSISVIDNRITVLKDYPNSKFFKGFDFAVSACGYNSFHELMYSRIPTIYIPNVQTTTDDQFLRAKKSEEVNLGIVIDKVNEKNIRQAISQIESKKIIDTQLFKNKYLFNGAQSLSEEIVKLRSNIN